MKAGEAQVGQRVRTVVKFAAYPEVPIGTLATIDTVETQISGAETDSIFIRPDSWMGEVMPCLPCDLELVK